MATLSPAARNLLGLLVAELPRIHPRRPQHFPTYKQVHIRLGLQLQRGAHYGESLKHQGLSDLAEWTKAEGKPAITGLIVREEDFQPGPGYFSLYGKNTHDFAWWEAEIAAAKNYDWQPYLTNVAVHPAAKSTPVPSPMAAPPKLASNRPKIDEIHVVCHTGTNVSNVTADSFVSGWWKVKAEHDVIGTILALHEDKSSLSYLQGRITAIVARDENRFQYQVQRSSIGLRWRGLSTGERGYLYANDERFAELPVVRCLIGPVDSAHSPGIRCLREGARWVYPLVSDLTPDNDLDETVRQQRFEDDVRRIAAVNDGVVPYAFRDIEGEPYRLDVGCVRYALARQILQLAPPFANGTVRAFILLTPKLAAEGVAPRIEDDGPQLAPAANTAAEYDPGDVPPDKVVQLVRQAQRVDQPAFRQALFKIYGGQCPVTGCAIPEILEAAHIVPYAEVGGAPADCRNGLLLRSDIHKLFDSGLIGFGFDQRGWLRVHIHHKLAGSDYELLHGRAVALPNPWEMRPSKACIVRRAAAFPILRSGNV